MNIQTKYKNFIIFSSASGFLLVISTFLKSSSYESPSTTREALTYIQAISCFIILICSALVVFSNSKSSKTPKNSQKSTYEKAIYLISVLLIATVIVFIILSLLWLISIMVIGYGLRDWQF